MSRSDIIQWENVIAEVQHEPGDRYRPEGVRRLAVPGGWIYQFEKSCKADETTGRILGRNYGGEVYVPNPREAK